jgi:hypothetical protein
MNSSLAWESELPFGLTDFKERAAERYDERAPDALINDERIACCIDGCTTWLPRRRRGMRSHEFCPDHHLSMSSTPTYVLKEPVRNLIVGRKLYRQLDHKVDRRRLTHESSEDSVSWNVFVGFFALAGLRELWQLLTGRECRNEPELYLWGNRINAASSRFWRELRQVQQELEHKHGKRIPTEPDIILRIPGEAIVVVEAKFGSPNSLFEKKEKRVGPIRDYLKNYIPRAGKTDPLVRKWIYSQRVGILEQLCRNAIYTSQLANSDEDQFLINLVLNRHEIDIVERFEKHLTAETIRFRRVTWEQIYDLPAIHSAGGRFLKRYFQRKSLRLRNAFDLSHTL